MSQTPPTPMTLPIVKLRANAVLPKQATSGSAGFDLCAALETPITLLPGERRLIPTGLAAAIPSGFVGILAARSGLSAKKGITAANGIGVIDSDYRGEIFFSAVNLSNAPYEIAPGERICQLLILPCLVPTLCPTDEIDKTERGVGGFGSTGA